MFCGDAQNYKMVVSATFFRKFQTLKGFCGRKHEAAIVGIPPELVFVYIHACFFYALLINFYPCGVFTFIKTKNHKQTELDHNHHLNWFLYTFMLIWFFAFCTLVIFGFVNIFVFVSLFVFLRNFLFVYLVLIRL